MRREQTETGEQQSQPEDQESKERFWSSLPGLLGQLPAGVANLGRKQLRGTIAVAGLTSLIGSMVPGM